jgi:hypothetical protein
VFVVSGCKASAWKNEIVYAKAAPIVKKPDPAPVVIVEKQTEFIPMIQPQPQPQPASETLTTVDFQVKVKTEPKLDVEVEAVSANTETCGTVETVSPAPQESIE